MPEDIPQQIFDSAPQHALWILKANYSKRTNKKFRSRRRAVTQLIESSGGIEHSRGCTAWWVLFQIDVTLVHVVLWLFCLSHMTVCDWSTSLRFVWGGAAVIYTFMESLFQRGATLVLSYVCSYGSRVCCGVTFHICEQNNCSGVIYLQRRLMSGSLKPEQTLIYPRSTRCLRVISHMTDRKTLSQGHCYHAVSFCYRVGNIFITSLDDASLSWHAALPLTQRQLSE